ncbi:MAG TPA: TatD family hydrolase [Rhabdochlamydiaceae bacterium]|jgi:TatD DNase family protein
MHFVDTHAHLTETSLCEQLEEILKRAALHGIAKIVNICTDEKTLDEGLLLSQREKWIYNAAATTPHDVEKEGELFFPLVEKAARAHKLVAIGETGLDYYYMHSPQKMQRDFLVRYFALAISLKLPVIFHCRDAFADLFALSDSHYKGRPAVLHCFTGTLEEAKGVLERGWYLSISGIATYKKSDALREVVQYVPLDRLFIETDTPYLAPQSRRGKVNEPSFMIETAEMIASLKGIKLEALGEITSQNAERFFSFSKV